MARHPQNQTPGLVAESEDKALRARIEQKIVFSIRKQFWDEGCSREGTIERHTLGNLVLIKRDNRYRMLVDNPRQWILDVILYRTHITLEPEFA